MTAIIEINDVALRIHHDDRVVVESPGYIHIDSRDAVIGEPAVGRAKLEPTRTEHRFWDRLGHNELEQKYRIARYQSDLAYFHLEDAWQRAGITAPHAIAVVPGDYDRDQVALLLGMAGRLRIPVKAVVDMGVAASLNPRPGRQLFHLDIHLHRTVVTRLEQGAALERVHCSATPEVGRTRLYDAWADAVAGIFVQHSRFDPMHEAEVEQSLFNQLAGWADALGEDDQVAVALQHGGRRYEAKLQRRTILEAAEPLYRRLDEYLADVLPQNQPISLQVSDRAARLPGLLDRLSRIPECEVLALPDDAVRAGLKKLYLPRQGGEGVPLVRSKPWFDRSAMDRHSEELASFRRTSPTHVLVGAVATPVGGGLTVGAGLNGAAGIDLDGVAGVSRRHLELKRDGSDVVIAHLGEGETRVNGQPAQPGQKIAAGDRLRVGAPGTELLMIAVRDSD